MAAATATTTATSTATLTANLAQDLCATTIKKPTERTRPFFCGIRVQLEFYIDYGVLAKNEIYFVPHLPSFPLPLSQTNPPLSVQAAVAATTPAKEPSQGALETLCRALFSSSSSNSLCIYMLYMNRHRNWNRHRATLELCFMLCCIREGGEGDSRSLLLLASFLDSTLVLARGSWLALRHFGLVCVRKCTWLDIFSGGCL